MPDQQATERPSLGADPTADPREICIVFTTRSMLRPQPIRDDAGRVRVCEPGSRRVGWARLADVDWTDTLP